MLLIGFLLLLPIFLLWELHYAPAPLMPPRIIRSRVVMCGTAAAFFYQLANLIPTHALIDLASPREW
jgi:hypothetical protein